MPSSGREPDAPAQEYWEVLIPMRRGHLPILRTICASRERNPTRTATWKPLLSSPPSLAQRRRAEQNEQQAPLPRERSCETGRTQELCVLMSGTVLSRLSPGKKALQTVSLGKRTFNHRVRGEEDQCRDNKLIESRAYKVKT